MSSHREAPEIAKDPVADSSDLYAFISPDRPDTVTLIANYVPMQTAAAGPNFFEFGEDVLYEINVDNNGDGNPDVVYQFRFTTTLRNNRTFLYNTGPIQSLDSPNFNRRQFFTVTRVQRGGNSTVLGRDLASPPCNIGLLSTPDYGTLAAAAVHDLGGGRRVFAGQRADGFYVDLGAIFDLGTLRPFANVHNHFGLAKFPSATGGVNTTKDLNVHSIALQVPITDLTSGRGPVDASRREAVIGVWTSASRQQVRIWDAEAGRHVSSGPFSQISRLGNPLVNEVIVPMAKKDLWNRSIPAYDKQFAEFVTKPELAGLLPTLYPGVFPNLDALNKTGKPRADLAAILLTGLPPGVVAGFQNNTGTTQADMLRLNTAVPPNTAKPSILGVLGGDLAGFPNGRRVFDDVVTVELRAIAGLTVPLVDKGFTPDKAAGQLTDGLTPDNLTVPFLNHFPYLGVPHSGFDTPAH
ncbi:DUF4331 domain-containing protein [Kutzneria viridogrisea]|uniref:DUF4331 domain-containing protein n=2 Tax=Kutzneria TaxID=43356 RepID=W5W4X0_9PSEU|nr:DUF4331 domain-containing protein [Kutzneria albida]AHH95942.1 hypothetical protein KALB_2574 [Kutzneria albida DSM 43870]MBA8928857.1 hypothetical protein [Kutzneria viridogrisea]